MKKNIFVLLISVLLIASLSSCSIPKGSTNPTPATGSKPVVVENIPSQDIPQNEPTNDGSSIDLKQQALENDPNITKGFVIAGSCIYDERSAIGGKLCVEFSNALVKDDCVAYGGQWQTSACDQKGYQKKCKDSFDATDKNGKTTGTFYQNTYTRAGSEMSCAGIEEML